MSCGDEKVRTCISIIATWHEDHMENVSNAGMKTNRFPVCVVANGQPGMIPETPYDTRDHSHYRRLLGGALKSTLILLESR